MMTALPKRRLGRGLAALIGDDQDTTPIAADTPGLKQLPIDLISANPKNPRRNFPDADIDSLAQSLKDRGFIQPLLVRPRKDGTFQIVAGERRWRAAQRAGLHDVPAIVRELDDKDTLELAIVENVQRSDLTPLEEAQAYRMLMDEFQYTQQQLAESIGKSRSHVANMLRLMNLPDSVKEHIEKGTLSAGHARALVATENPQELAQRIISLGLSVRQAEDLSRQDALKPKKRKREKDADTRSLEKSLSQALGLTVSIQHRAPGGNISIGYKTLEQLEMVARLLGRKN
jgi:ParB family transcriptional regulator, chromosome partitioning protein